MNANTVSVWGDMELQKTHYQNNKQILQVEAMADVTRWLEVKLLLIIIMDRKNIVEHTERQKDQIKI